MDRLGRISLTVVGAVGLATAVVVLRADVEPTVPPVVGPDGVRISAYHDSRLVTPPPRTDARPSRPAELQVEARRRQALVAWAGEPGGYQVRWARTDGDGPAGSRYVTTPATTLTDLEPGSYRVEVSAVDDAGRRSEPSRAEVQVGDERPGWERGLGFLADLTTGGGLDRDLWRDVPDAGQCLSREQATGPLLLSTYCFTGTLSPASPLVLSEPDGEGVRGRVVVVADSPTAAPPDGRGGNELTVRVGPSDGSDDERITLGLRASGGYLAIGMDDGGAAGWGEPPPAVPATGPRPAPTSDPAETGRRPGQLPGELDLPVVTGPGVLHRWELVFTVDQVRVSQNGRLVGTAAFRPGWDTAEVAVAAVNRRPGAPDEAVPAARVELIGLTGPGPDGRAAEVIQLSQGRATVGPVSPLAYRPSPTAERGRLTGRIFVDGSEGMPAPPPLSVVVGGQTIEVAATVDRDGPFTMGYLLDVDLPLDQVRAGGTVSISSPDPTAMSLYEVQLEITHQPGADVPDIPVRVQPPPLPVLPRPRLRVLRDGAPVPSSTPLPPGPLEVEVTVPPQAGPAPAAWVAIRVEMDGRRILDHPTGADGPAVTCTGLRFVLHADDLGGSYQRLQVTLVPADPGVDPARGLYTLRLQG